MRKTTKNHGLTGAVITVIVLVLLMVLSAGAMLGDYFGSGGGGFEAGVIILCALLCLAVAVGVIVALVQRGRILGAGYHSRAARLVQNVVLGAGGGISGVADSRCAGAASKISGD